MTDFTNTPPFLLDELKMFTEGAVAHLILPCRPTKKNPSPADRAASVHLMRLSKKAFDTEGTAEIGAAAKDAAPYIIHQVITTDDGQTEGGQDSSEVCIRSIFCVYCDDEQQGGLFLLNLTTRYKVALLRKVMIGGRFKLNKKRRVQSILYPDDTAPFYAGEMSYYFELPAIKREVL